MEKIKSEISGQAVVEYILLLAIVVSLYVAVLSMLSQSNTMSVMKKPFTVTLKYTYQYGNATSRGQTDGGPTNIVQYSSSSGTDQFRIFINPPISE